MEGAEEGSALTLNWTLGLAKDYVGCVHNLSDHERTEMLYAAGHTAVVFDYNTGVQRLLQGHVNPITATTVSQDKKWIVTATRVPTACSWSGSGTTAARYAPSSTRTPTASFPSI
jgi:hypothetical protein